MLKRARTILNLLHQKAKFFRNVSYNALNFILIAIYNIWFLLKLTNIEAATGAVLYKKLFLKISQILQVKFVLESLF